MKIDHKIHLFKLPIDLVVVAIQLQLHLFNVMQQTLFSNLTQNFNKKNIIKRKHKLYLFDLTINAVVIANQQQVHVFRVIQQSKF
jgi:hypothetical protein